MTRLLSILLSALLLTAPSFAQTPMFPGPGMPASSVACDATSPDPSFASVVLLAVNDNQADTTTTFDDQSNSNHTLTAAGNAQYDTALAPTGMTSSLLAATVNDYVKGGAGGSTDFSFPGDWTIEVWGYFTLRNNVSPWGVGAGFFVGINSSGNLFYYDGGVRNLGTTMSGSTWTHMAWDRVGDQVYGYTGGTVGTTPITNSSTQGSGNTEMQIANDGRGGSGNGFAGSLAAIRITKGVARYAGSSFTPPCLPLPTS